MHPKLRHTLVVVALLIATAISFINKENSLYLILWNPDTGQQYASYWVQPNTIFSVEFIHSVNQSAVREYYEIKKDCSIILVKSVYYNFGAGVQTELNPGETLSYGADGSMEVNNIQKPMPNLIYCVGTVSDHTLFIQKESVSLRSLCGRNSKVGFMVAHQANIK